MTAYSVYEYDTNIESEAALANLLINMLSSCTQYLKAVMVYTFLKLYVQYRRWFEKKPEFNKHRVKTRPVTVWWRGTNEILARNRVFYEIKKLIYCCRYVNSSLREYSSNMKIILKSYVFFLSGIFKPSSRVMILSLFSLQLITNIINWYQCNCIINKVINYICTYVALFSVELHSSHQHLPNYYIIYLIWLDPHENV